MTIEPKMGLNIGCIMHLDLQISLSRANGFLYSCLHVAKRLYFMFGWNNSRRTWML